MKSGHAVSLPLSAFSDQLSVAPAQGFRKLKPIAMNSAEPKADSAES
jgi:hypothetical protein